jgi:hypothetical protein
MGKISQHEDDWQRRATDAAIVEVRRAIGEFGSAMHTPLSKLSDLQLGWIIAPALFAWITKRCEQAIAEGVDREDAVRMLEADPSPADVAAARSILPDLCDQAKVDWSLPLSAWTKETMTDFVLLTWKLMNQAEAARDAGPGIIQKSSLQDELPFG